MSRTDTRDLIPTLPARLTEVRKAAGLSQQDLAAAAGTSIFSVSKIEKGRRSPSFALAAKIADALQVTTDTLLAAPGEKISKKRKEK